MVKDPANNSRIEGGSERSRGRVPRLTEESAGFGGRDRKG
jgi:hypothetical protein